MDLPECPDEPRLRAYLTGELPPHVADAVARHLETCAPCEDTVEQLEAGGPWFPGPLGPAEPSPPGGAAVADEPGLTLDPHFRRMVEAARSIQAETVPLSDGATEFLPESDPDMPVLGGYRLVEKVGQGGMGVVYRATHLRLKRTVAVKLLATRHVRKTEALGRFEREMEAVGRLDHPNIVKATDAGEHDGIHYLVMEYVDGMDLARLVKTRGTLGVAEACELVRRAALGLQHAHDNGLVHRDVKPSNLLLTRSGQLKVLDLGLALLRDPLGPGGAESPAATAESPAAQEDPAVGKASSVGTGEAGEGGGAAGSSSLSAGVMHAEDVTSDVLDPPPASPQPESPQPLAPPKFPPIEGLTETGQVLGTADYMAPEQWRSMHAVDGRADVYGLGGTLYFLLTGSAPYPAPRYATAADKMAAHLRGAVPDVRLLRPDVPREVAAYLARMFAKAPEDRPATAGEVAAALGPFSLPLPSLETLTTAEVRPPVRGKRLGWMGWMGWTLPALLLIPAAWWGVANAPAIYRIVTNRGTLILESSDPDVEITIRRNGLEIAVLDRRTGKTIDLPAGLYHAEISAGTGLTLSTENFVVARGGREILRVFREPPAVAAVPSSLAPAATAVPAVTSAAGSAPVASTGSVPVPSGTGGPTLPETVPPPAYGSTVLEVRGFPDGPRIPTKVQPASWARPGVVAEIVDQGRIEWADQPTAWWGFEADLHFRKKDSILKFQFGETGMGTEIVLGPIWDRDLPDARLPCQLFRAQPFGVNWDGEAHFPADERMTLKLLAGDQHKILFRNGKRVLQVFGEPTDFHPKIVADRGARVTIHRCTVFKLTREDAAAVGWTLPENQPRYDVAEASRLAAARAAGLDNRPVEGRPFVDATVGGVMLWVPPGEIVLGTSDDPERDKTLKVQPVVISSGYWLGQCEVTIGAWQRVFDDKIGRNRVAPELPVNGVSAERVQEFLRFLTAVEKAAGRVPEGYEYRLPSEAEWEYACRAGTRGPRAVPNEAYWYRNTSNGRVQPVGLKPPNPWGFHDMHGNVPEWCLDSYQEYPTAGTAVPLVDRRIGNLFNSVRAVRGGGWFHGEEDCRTTSRSKGAIASTGANRGFRVALGKSLPLSAPPKPGTKPVPRPTPPPPQAPKPQPGAKAAGTDQPPPAIAPPAKADAVPK